MEESCGLATCSGALEKPIGPPFLGELSGKARSWEAPKWNSVRHPRLVIVRSPTQRETLLPLRLLNTQSTQWASRAWSHTSRANAALLACLFVLNRLLPPPLLLRSHYLHGLIRGCSIAKFNIAVRKSLSKDWALKYVVKPEQGEALTWSAGEPLPDTFGSSDACWLLGLGLRN